MKSNAIHCNREDRMKPCLGCLTLLLLLYGQAAAEPPAGLVVYFESAEHMGSLVGRFDPGAFETPPRDVANRR